MVIAIRSEVDSRVMIYPLLKCLYNYGTIGVYTTNPMFSRLIENELEGGFKNINIMVSLDADLEGVKEADEYYKNKYDFLILDNIGAIDYDIMFAVVTNRLTEQYVNDMVYVVADDKTRLIKFGSPAPMSKDAQKKGKQEAEEVQENDDDFNKWHHEQTDEDILRDLLAKNDAKWLKFPTFEQIEAMEGRHYMMIPGDDYIREIYKHIKDWINVDERNFTKGVKIKDESSSDISGTDVR